LLINLQKKGLNIVLISRNQTKLVEQAKELEMKFQVQTKIVPVDFSSEEPTMYEPIKQTINELDIGILVNNVGISYDHPQYLHELDTNFINRLIQVNINGTTHMTHLVLPGMLQRRRGCIVNIGSATEIIEEPLYAVYAGTKSFIKAFSRSLHYEYKDRGIHVQCCVPALVVSKMSKVRRSSLFAPSPSQFVRSAISSIGYGSYSIPYWAHALQLWAVMCAPESRRFSYFLSHTKDIRRRALLKKEGEKEKSH